MICLLSVVAVVVVGLGVKIMFWRFNTQSFHPAGLAWTSNWIELWTGSDWSLNVTSPASSCFEDWHKVTDCNDKYDCWGHLIEPSFSRKASKPLPPGVGSNLSSSRRFSCFHSPPTNPEVHFSNFKTLFFVREIGSWADFGTVWVLRLFIRPAWIRETSQKRPSQSALLVDSLADFQLKSPARTD